MILRSIDMLSDEIKIGYKDYKGHGTKFGGLLTIFILQISFALSIYFSLGLIDRQNPTSFFVSRYIDDAGTINLTSQGLFHAIAIKDPFTLEYIPFDPRALQVVGIPSLTDKNTNQYFYGPCSNSTDTNSINNLINFPNFSDLACIKAMMNVTTNETILSTDPQFSYPTISHGVATQTKTPSEYFSVVMKCVNSTFNNNSCYDNDKINKLITGMVVVFYLIDNNFDVSDYKNPISKYLYSTSSVVADASYAMNILNINPVLLETHDGFLFDSISQEISYKFQNNEKLTYTKDDSNPMILNFAFFLQNQNQVYTRSYIRVQDVLANIGGAVKSLFIIGYLINYMFYKFQVITDTTQLLKTKGVDIDSQIIKLKTYPIRVSQIKSQSGAIQIRRERNLNAENLSNLPRYNSAHVSIYKENSQKEPIELRFIDFVLNKLRCSTRSSVKAIEDLRKFLLNEEQIFKLFYDVVKIKNHMLLDRKFQHFYQSKLSIEDLYENFSDEQSSVYPHSKVIFN